MRRRRWIVAAAVLVALLAAVEVGVRAFVRPKAGVMIVNEGVEPIEDLVVVYRDTRMPAGRLSQGESVQVWLTAGPPGPLKLEYRQKGNAIQGFQLADYEPEQNISDGYKLVLAIGTNQVQRSMEPDETRRDDEPFGTRILRWLQADPDATR
jgi:hypothetical protein